MRELTEAELKLVSGGSRLDDLKDEPKNRVALTGPDEEDENGGGSGLDSGYNPDPFASIPQWGGITSGHTRADGAPGVLAFGMPGTGGGGSSFAGTTGGLGMGAGQPPADAFSFDAQFQQGFELPEATDYNPVLDNPSHCQADNFAVCVNPGLSGVEYDASGAVEKHEIDYQVVGTHGDLAFSVESQFIPSASVSQYVSPSGYGLGWAGNMIVDGGLAAYDTLNNLSYVYLRVEITGNNGFERTFGLGLGDNAVPAPEGIYEISISPQNIHPDESLFFVSSAWL